MLQCLVDDGPEPHHDLKPHDLGLHHDLGPHRSVMLSDWHEILMKCGCYAAMAKMVVKCEKELLY